MSRAHLVQLLREGRRFLVTCHVRPDSDALGSALGMAAMLRTLGKDAVVYSQDGVPPNLLFLAGSSTVHGSVPTGAFDATLVMDAAAQVLVPSLPPRERSGPVVVVDHHAAHDGFGEVVDLRDGGVEAGTGTLGDAADHRALVLEGRSARDREHHACRAYDHEQRSLEARRVTGSR